MLEPLWLIPDGERPDVDAHCTYITRSSHQPSYLPTPSHRCPPILLDTKPYTTEQRWFIMADADSQWSHEQISSALEVEQLDVNLYRSKTLYLPPRARGVFGGQVISQALVSASNCVDPAFGLHVR